MNTAEKTRPALGLFVGRELYARYALYVVVGLVLPALVFGVDRALLLEFAEQVTYIGVAEEVFSRGYLMRRLCDWFCTGCAIPTGWRSSLPRHLREGSFSSTFTCGPGSSFRGRSCIPL